jgi:hypothetical protein
MSHYRPEYRSSDRGLSAVPGIDRKVSERIANGLQSLAARLLAGERPACHSDLPPVSIRNPTLEEARKYLAAEVEKIIAEAVAPTYGLCPHCGSPGVFRERRPGGNDACAEGHVYPSKAAVIAKGEMQ